jgi:hypothetical protein
MSLILLIFIQMSLASHRTNRTLIDVIFTSIFVMSVSDSNRAASIHSVDNIRLERLH